MKDEPILKINCNYPINHIGLFPSGKFVIASRNLNIYDIEYNLLQEIYSGEKKDFHQIEIINENNFIVAYESSILFYTFSNNQFIYKESINTIGLDEVMKIIYTPDKIYIAIISGEINIIEKNEEGEYEIKKRIYTETSTYSILLCENHNLLLIGEREGINLLNINDNYNKICLIKSPCIGRNALQKIDNDNIITGGDFYRILFIVNIKNKQIISCIENETSTWAILVLNDYIFTGGLDRKIRIFKKNTLYLYKRIINQHTDEIKGFIKFKDGKIGSYALDGILNIFEKI